MAATYKVLRVNDPSDAGPNGEAGVVIAIEDGKLSSAVTVLCKDPAPHGKECAQKLLDAGTWDTGKLDADKKPVMETPRERLDAWLSGAKARVAAAPVAAKLGSGNDLNLT